MPAFKTLLRDLSLNSWGIMKVGCIGRDIDGVQLTTSSLFGDDGVVTFTSRLLPTVFKRVLCKHVNSSLLFSQNLPCLPQGSPIQESVGHIFPHLGLYARPPQLTLCFGNHLMLWLYPTLVIVIQESRK